MCRAIEGVMKAEGRRLLCRRWEMVEGDRAPAIKSQRVPCSGACGLAAEERREKVLAG